MKNIFYTSFKLLSKKISIYTLLLAGLSIQAQNRQTCNGGSNWQAAGVVLNSSGNLITSPTSTGCSGSGSPFAWPNPDTVVVHPGHTANFPISDLSWGNRVLIIYGELVTPTTSLSMGSDVKIMVLGNGKLRSTGNLNLITAGKIFVDENAAIEFGNLSINANADLNIKGSATVSGNVNMSGANAVLYFGKNVFIDGNLTISGNHGSATFAGDLAVDGNFNMNGSKTITVLGNLDVDGDVTSTGSTVVNLNGNVNIDGNLESNQTSSITVNGTLNLDGNYNATGSSTATFNGSTTVDGNIQTNSSAIVTVNGNTNIDGNVSVNQNSQINIGSSSTVNTNNFSVNGSGIVNIDGTVDVGSGNFTMNNNTTQVNGSGYIEGDISNGGGSINGIPGSNGTPPLTPLGATPNTALVWEPGKSWRNGNIPGQGPHNVAGRSLLFEEDYSFGVDPGNVNQKFGRIAVGNNKKVTIGPNYINASRFDPANGEIAFMCQSRISPNAAIETTGNGRFTITNCLQEVGWYFLSFPVRDNGSVRLGDIDIVGAEELHFSGNKRNIYQWDPAQSSWVSIAITANTTLGGKSFIFYATQANAELHVEIPPGQFNNTDQDVIVRYHNPGTANPGGSDGWAGLITDGWVMIQNPFQDEIDWNYVKDSMDLNNVFSGSAVYKWDRTSQSYISWNTNDPTNDARFIKPYEAVFVNANANIGAGSSTFPVKNAFRNDDLLLRTAQSGLPAIILEVKGEGYTAQTKIMETSASTRAFDGYYDAYFMPSLGYTPSFYSVSDDSLALSINQMPDLEDSVALGFVYHQNNKDFTISVRKEQLHSVVNVYLLDTYTNSITDLNKGDYNFRYNENAPAERFRLFVLKNGLSIEDAAEQIAEEKTDLGVHAWFNEQGIQIETSEELINAHVQLMSISGQTIFSGRFNRLKEQHISVNPAAGVYIVWIHSEKGSVSKKVFKSQ